MATTSAVGGSQIDVQSLVAQLVAADRATPDAQIQRQTSQVTTQISALGQLMGSLSSFRSALSSLKSVDVFSTRTATSSSDTTLSVTAGAKAVPGDYDIEVIQLAKAQQISSTAFADGATTVVGTGTLTVSVGGKSFDITIDSSNSTLAGIRDAINGDADNTGVRATLVTGTDGSRLVLSSSQTGAANKITVAQAGGDGGLAQISYSESSPENYTVVKPAQDAIISIANAQSTSASNTIDKAIDGVTLTLKAETTEESGPVTISVGYDTTGVNTRIKNFVTAYNSLMSQIGKLRSYDATTKTAGPMLGDSLLTSIESQLRTALSTPVAGQPQGFQTLASIGITTQLDGTLAIDDGKLQKALTGNFEAVGKLFGSDTGVGAVMFKKADDLLKSDGAIENRGKNLTAQQKDIQQRKDDLDERMLVLQKAYTAQFTRLDTLLSSLQVTSSYLSQQIESLPKMNGK
jgi:flagellar hook-associated protein 2